MDFNLTEDQIMMRDTAREFAEKRLFPIAEELDEKGAMPIELINEAAELGFFGLLAPEEFGGLALDTLSYILCIEEIAKACAGLAIAISVHNSLVTKAIEIYGTDAQKQEYLPKLATGEIIGAYSLSEPDAGTDAGSLKCQAIASGDDYIFNGTKSWVSSAEYAGIIIVFALTDPEKGPKGISTFIVPKGTDGMSLGAPEKKMGLKCSDTREVSFMDAKVPKANLLGEENKGFKVALSLLDNGRVGVGAQALGISQAAFDEALKYSKERKQFGQHISGFQLVQGHIADMAVMVESARLLTFKAAWLHDQGKPCGIASAMAKLYASEIATKVAHKAVQIHGGYGYIKDYVVERLYRDARIMELYEGTSEIQRVSIALDMLKH